MDINSVASTTVVLGFAWGVFAYVVLKPLNLAIDNLNKAVGELRMEILTAERRRHDLEIKVAEIDQRAKSAHHRIDRLEGRAHDEGVEHR